MDFLTIWARNVKGNLKYENATKVALVLSGKGKKLGKIGSKRVGKGKLVPNFTKNVGGQI